MAIQKSLWGNEDKRPEVEIYIPSDEEIAMFTEQMNKKNLGDIQEMAEPFLKYAKKHHLYALDANGNKYYPDVTEKKLSGEKILKKDWIKFYVTLNHIQNFEIFFAEMSEKEKNLFICVLFNHYLNEEDAEKILGEKVIVPVGGRWSYREAPKGNLRLWYNHVRTKARPIQGSSYRTYGNYLELRGGLYNAYLPGFCQEIVLAPNWLELPDEAKKELTVYSNESFIFTIIPILSSLYKAQQIDFGKSKVTAAAVKKAAKTLNIKEFFPNGDKLSSVLASTFIINSYSLYCTTHPHSYGSMKPENLLKDMLISNNHYDNILLSLLLPHHKGFRKNFMGNFTGSELFSCIFSSLIHLAETEEREWIDIDLLCLITRIINKKGERIFMLFDLYAYFDMEIFNGYDQHDVYIDNAIAEITMPLIKSYIFMMASLGFVEIAYKEVSEEEEANSCFDGLRYVRLTNLGRYAFELISKYVKTKQKGIKFFETNGEDLIVKSLVEDNPYESILANMAEHISKKLYKVTPESFLKDCKGQEDIENHINLFKEYIEESPSANWNAFFKQLLDRCAPMLNPKKKYRLVQLPASDKELQHIMLCDPTIRKYILKAENYHVLIEEEYIPKVCAILKKYGYLA